MRTLILMAILLLASLHVQAQATPDLTDVQVITPENADRLVELHVIDEQQRVFNADFNPDSTLLAYTTLNSLVVWDIADQYENWRLTSEGTAAVAFSPDNQMMAASYDGGLYLWNAASPDALREFTIPVTGRTGPVSEIEFAQGGERLIVARRGPVGGLWQWDVDSGEYLGVSVPGYGEPATAARSILSQNGELNIVSRADRVLEFRETMDGRLIRAFGIDQLLDIDVDEQPFSVEALAFSEVHRAALICVCFNAAREMRILLLGEEGDILFDYTFYLSLIFTGAVSSDGSLLALGDVEDGDIYIVDVATGEQSITLRGHWERIHDLQFNFNDTLLVSTSLDGTLRLWGIPAGE